jgi:hypothetical protein
MSLLNRIWAPHSSQRLVYLICLVIGIFAAKSFQGIEKPAGSIFLVHIAPVQTGFDDGSSHGFDPADGRELTSYAAGGHVQECSWREGKEWRRCLRDREEARRFTYEHWQSKQRAYIAIDFPCVDCAPTMHVFIEPNEAGIWRITIVNEEPRYPVRRDPDAFGLMYRKTREDDRWREPAPRVLSFRDLSNVEVHSF